MLDLKMSMLRFISTMCVLLGTTCGHAVGQPGVLASRVQRYDLDSGQVAPAGGQRSVAWQTIIREPGAAWLRLHFETLDLPGSVTAGTAAELVLTSLPDGGRQVLDSQTAREWGRSSAYFNGDAVLVQLVMSSGTRPGRIELGQVTVGLPTSGEPRSICGDEDDRVRWEDPRVARVLGYSNGTYTPLCTAWLIRGTGRDLLTAGHCVWGHPPDNCDVYQPWQLSVVEFNVPLSDSFGNPQFADPSDQYAADPGSFQHSSECAAIGDDWCYFGVFPNSNTGLDPLWQQGDYYALPETYPDLDGSPIVVAGYGVDTWPNVDNQALQADWGMFNNVEGTVVKYHDLDTESGCSGAPIEKVSDHVAVGIHTHGGCEDQDAWHNHGTTIDHPGLQDALANPIGVCASPTWHELASRSFTVTAYLSGGVVFSEVASRSFVVKCHVAGGASFYEIASRAFTIEHDPDWTPPCPADINGDNLVGVDDALALISAWGSDDAAADVNNDGVVDTDDLLAVLAAWGPC